MKLFKYEGYRITIEPEAMLLKPFKKIWDRDKTASKDKGMMELGFIYFFCDIRSDQQYIIDPEERKNAIKLGEGMLDTWEPDRVINDAIEFYNSFKTSSSLLLEDTRAAVDKLRKLLRDIDLTKEDDKGKPVYTLNTVSAAIKQVPVLAKDLDEAERAITKELNYSDKVRGSAEKSMYEDL